MARPSGRPPRRARRALCVSLALLLVLLAGGGPAGAARKKRRRGKPVSPITSPVALQAAVKRAIRGECRRPKGVGVLIRAIFTGETLFAHRAGEKRIPASNVKILISAAALARLGPDYTFPTDVYADGPVSGGVLQGDLYLKGYGDPVLVPEKLHYLAHRVRLRGIRKVEGDLVADDTFFDSKRAGKGWKKGAARPYQAPHGALAVNFSVVTVYVEPGAKARKRARVQIDPPSDGVRLVNRTVTGPRRGRSTIRIKRRTKDGVDIIEVRGRIPGHWPRVRYRVSVSDPTRFAATTFSAYLRGEGIRLEGGVRTGVTPPEARLIERHLSRPLGAIIRDLNQFSNNFVAEQVLKTLGAEVEEPPGTAEKGLAVVRDFLERMGIPPGEFILADGSGLSRLNRLTPWVLVTVLEGIHRDFRLRPEFLASLAVIGVDGTVRKRLRRSKAARRIRAKTGLLFGVHALSGYAAAKNGETLAFSIIVNKEACRSKRLMNRISLAMTAFDRPHAGPLKRGFGEVRKMLSLPMPRPLRRDRWRRSGRARGEPSAPLSEEEGGGREK